MSGSNLAWYMESFNGSNMVTKSRSFICCALSCFYFMGGYITQNYQSSLFTGVNRAYFSGTHFTASKTQSGCCRDRFARGLFLFSAGVIGGGDVKLLTILSLAIDEHELANFLVAMTFCGALVVLAGLLFFENQLVKTVCLMLYQFHWLFCLHILFSLCFVNSLGQHK